MPSDSAWQRITIASSEWIKFQNQYGINTLVRRTTSIFFIAGFIVIKRLKEMNSGRSLRLRYLRKKLKESRPFAYAVFVETTDSWRIWEKGCIISAGETELEALEQLETI